MALAVIISLKSVALGDNYVNPIKIKPIYAVCNRNIGQRSFVKFMTYGHIHRCYRQLSR